MKFLTFAFLIASVSASGAASATGSGIDETFTHQCARRDDTKCTTRHTADGTPSGHDTGEKEDCCAKFKKKGSAYRYDGIHGYYCLTYSQRLLYGAEYVDESDNGQRYRWVC